MPRSREPDEPPTWDALTITLVVFTALTVVLILAFLYSIAGPHPFPVPER